MTITYTLKQDSDDIWASHRFTSDKGCISLVQPQNWTNDKYEIYCISGALFEDTDRFDSLDEAMKAVLNYLS